MNVYCAPVFKSASPGTYMQPSHSRLLLDWTWADTTKPPEKPWHTLLLLVSFYSWTILVNLFAFQPPEARASQPPFDWGLGMDNFFLMGCTVWPLSSFTGCCDTPGNHHPSAVRKTLWDTVKNDPSRGNTAPGWVVLGQFTPPPPVGLDIQSHDSHKYLLKFK